MCRKRIGFLGSLSDVSVGLCLTRRPTLSVPATSWHNRLDHPCRNAWIGTLRAQGVNALCLTSQFSRSRATANSSRSFGGRLHDQVTGGSRMIVAPTDG